MSRAKSRRASHAGASKADFQLLRVWRRAVPRPPAFHRTEVCRSSRPRQSRRAACRVVFTTTTRGSGDDTPARARRPPRASTTPLFSPDAMGYTMHAGQALEETPQRRGPLNQHGVKGWYDFYASQVSVDSEGYCDDKTVGMKHVAVRDADATAPSDPTSRTSDRGRRRGNPPRATPRCPRARERPRAVRTSLVASHVARRDAWKTNPSTRSKIRRADCEFLGTCSPSLKCSCATLGANETCTRFVRADDHDQVELERTNSAVEDSSGLDEPRSFSR